MRVVVYMLLAFLGQIFVASAAIKVEKNIDYSAVKGDIRRQLNIYHKTGVDTAQDVLIFIHGGSWSSGKKETYWWLGRNFARKGLVTVLINYGLAPDNKYQQMGTDCATAVKWVVLNDAFGLDMHEYLSTAEKDADYYNFLRTFSKDPSAWTAGSPLNYIQNTSTPHLIFYGAKTYPAIQLQSERIHNEFQANHVRNTMHVIKGKKHVGMISQMIFGCNKLYKYILDFTKNN
jgi:dipeptidyl aminopeptidase/acylaminoacyl peptidase